MSKKNPPSSGLILISTDFVSGAKRLSQILTQIKSFGAIELGSSVYRKYLGAKAEDLNSEICLVVKLRTFLTDRELIRGLRELTTEELKTRYREPEKILLLCYDDKIQVIPGLNLPHPILHSDGLTLRCAAEVWPEYSHPVLGQTLNELVRCRPVTSEFDFFSQFDRAMEVENK